MDAAMLQPHGENKTDAPKYKIGMRHEICYAL